MAPTGYIADQFLTDYTNRRNDEYGGPVNRRVRFHCEVVSEVRSELGGRAPFGIRISQTKVNDLSHSWAGGVDDARTIFGAIGDAGPDYIHVNAHHGFEPVFGSGKSLARLARDAVPTGVQIIACGKLNDPTRARRHAGRRRHRRSSHCQGCAGGSLLAPQNPGRRNAPAFRSGHDPPLCHAGKHGRVAPKPPGLTCPARLPASPVAGS